MRAEAARATCGRHGRPPSDGANGVAITNVRSRSFVLRRRWRHRSPRAGRSHAQSFSCLSWIFVLSWLTSCAFDRDRDEAVGGDRRRHSRGDQRLPPVERHDPVADSGDLPDPESDLSVELRADRIDYAHPATDGVVAAAAGRHVYGPAADAVLARRGHGVHARRTAAALIGGQARDASDRGGADGRRIVGVSPGVVSRGEDGVRRAARSRAVGVSGRRQLRIVFGPAPGGIRRRPPGSAEHRVVLAAGAGRDRPAVQGGPMVGSTEASHPGIAESDHGGSFESVAPASGHFTRGSARADFLEVCLSGRPEQLLHVLPD